MGWKARLVCVGGLGRGFARDGFDHYLERLRPHMDLALAEVKDGRGPAQRRMAHEGRSILKALDPRDFVVLLDERGRQWDSRSFARRLNGWFEDPGRTPCFVIGGPFGVSDDVRARADARLALSAMTWPHELARLLLAEQLYRAASILKGAPYHHD